MVRKRILLATGIYPPDIGGPATYVRALAGELSEQVEVVVVTYGGIGDRGSGIGTSQLKDDKEPHSRFQTPDSNTENQWKVVSVPKAGGPLLRWWRFSRALRKHGDNADIIYAFSSISCGVPLILSGLKKPKRILRLGGDFFWERYSALGGMKSLREWYEQSAGVFKWLMQWILNQFDLIIFSTHFQQELYKKHYKKLPKNIVVENARAYDLSKRENAKSQKTNPKKIQLLFMGRFVGFKNLPRLLKAVAQVPDVSLTLVGDGPYKQKIEKLIAQYSLEERVRVHPLAHGDEKIALFTSHDWLIIPSTTEISPNTALEAVAAGLPVLLTKENGLSPALQQGMVIQPLLTVEQIVITLQELQPPADESMTRNSVRGWDTVAAEHWKVFSEMLE